MSFFARDRVGPKASEMNSCPPGERDARQRQGRKHVDAAIAEMPDRLLAQHLCDPGRKQNAAYVNRNVVGTRFPGLALSVGLAGPERRHAPPDKSRDPTER